MPPTISTALRRSLTTGLLLAAVLGLPAHAHDIPTRVTLQAFVKPQEDRLLLLVRVPLEAMQDMEIPTTGPGYLDLEGARDSGVLGESASFWVGENVEIFEDGRRLPPLELVAARISLPSDRSFESWERARAHLDSTPLAAQTDLPWRQAMLDALFQVPIDSEEARFSMRPHHASLGVQVLTVLRYLPPGGGVRAFEYRSEPGLLLLDPRWHQAARRFVESGFYHILQGLDHLLFLGCLVIPLRRLRDLVIVVTSFTVAHSVTLIAAAFGMAPTALWFPPLVELLIAASIVYMAFENILGARLERRWLMAFGFGLVHGFGFSFLLRDTLQFAGSHLLTSLLSFNLGVELGQLFVLVLLVPLLDLLFRRVDEKLGVILLSAIIAHTAWHWMSERAVTLGEYRLAPALPAPVVSALPWVAPIVVLAIVGWRAYRGKPERPPGTGGATGPARAEAHGHLPRSR